MLLTFPSLKDTGGRVGTVALEGNTRNPYDETILCLNLYQRQYPYCDNCTIVLYDVTTGGNWAKHT